MNKTSYFEGYVDLDVTPSGLQKAVHDTRSGKTIVATDPASQFLVDQLNELDRVRGYARITEDTGAVLLADLVSFIADEPVMRRYARLPSRILTDDHAPPMTIEAPASANAS